jgi:hypothetical protein
VNVAGDVVTVPLTVATSTEKAELPTRSHPFSPAFASVLGLGFLGGRKRRGLRRISGALMLGVILCTGCGVNGISGTGVNGTSTASTTSAVSVVAAYGSVQPVVNFSLTVDPGATPSS